MTKNKTVLFIIDPQNDFMDKPGVPGSLAVPGSYEDMKRLAASISNNPPQSIIVSMDTHNRMDIAHNSWWVSSDGKNPSAFTIITHEDVKNGNYRTVDSGEQANALHYLSELEKGGKQSLCIWPDHCIKGTWGHEVTDVLIDALEQWEQATGSTVMYVYKGENPHTEHYSALKAEVTWDDNGYSDLRADLIMQMAQYDIISIAGEAKSHCVANTVYDLVSHLNATGSKTKIKIISNCMSSVKGFEKLSEIFDAWVENQNNMEVINV